MESSEETKVSNDVFDLVFRKARTYNAWLPKPVPDDLLFLPCRQWMAVLIRPGLFSVLRADFLFD
jgi:hypothetical protein